MENALLYKIVIGLMGFMAISGSICVWLVIRLIKGYDDKIRDVYCKIEDLPAVREAIKWLKGE